MRAAALERRSPVESLLLFAAVVLSLLAHAALGAGVTRIEPRVAESEPEWVEMTFDMTEPEPEPEPPPEPPPPEPDPEPEVKKPEVKKPEVEPEPVEFEETTPETETPPPEPEPKKRPVRRMTQGLSNDSFAEGAGTNLDARRGTTTSTNATEDMMKIDDEGEFEEVAYTSVTVAPRISKRLVLTVPQEIIDAGIEGRVEVELHIGSDGSVSTVEVVQGLHPAADAACIAALKKTTWKPGQRDGEPIGVRGVPYSCRYEAVD